MVLASQGKVQVPLYWELLDNKSGNSSTQNRIGVVAKCLKLLGSKRIGLLAADPTSGSSASRRRVSPSASGCQSTTRLSDGTGG